MDVRSLPIGTVVHERYKIVKVLGAGGFGVTYKVTDLKDGSNAAMKEYMPLDVAYRPSGSLMVRPRMEAEKAVYEKFHQKFYEEAQVVYSLRGHPNIVEISDLFFENNTVYYVMEYVEGMDMRQLLKQHGGRIPWNVLAPMLHQVMDGLTQVHNRGLIHCDISPDNIFVLNNGQVKLLDFGAARYILRGTVNVSVIVAKPGFAPPEQMRGRNMNTWTDVYALAVTIYCCVTGRIPQEAIERMTNDKTIWPSQMGFVVPSPYWEPALKKALALRVEDRYQTIEEFRKGLFAGMASAKPQNMQQHQYNQQNQHNQHRAGQYPIPKIVGVRGVYANRALAVNREYCLGSDPGKCHIVFPAGTPGVSRIHARIWTNKGDIVVMDMGSTYGTTIDGKKLAQGCAYRLRPGSLLCLGGVETFQAM